MKLDLLLKEKGTNGNIERGTIMWAGSISPHMQVSFIGEINTVNEF